MKSRRQPPIVLGEDSCTLVATLWVAELKVALGKSALWVSALLYFRSLRVTAHRVAALLVLSEVR